MRARKSAYYSRNDSFSRSYNAEVAEDEGRLPRSRAAASLGLSVAAFDAGCAAVNYRATEWHHVGKFAVRVDYYDCTELDENPEFWRGAAAAYKSAKKQAEVLATMARRAEAERRERVEEFRARLIRQRNCTRPVKRHSAAEKWRRRCYAAGIGTSIPVGDLAKFREEAAKVAASRAKVAAEKQASDELRNRLSAELDEILSTLQTAVDFNGNQCRAIDETRRVRRHQSGVNFWSLNANPPRSECLTVQEAITRLKNRIRKCESKN